MSSSVLPRRIRRALVAFGLLATGLAVAPPASQAQSSFSCAIETTLIDQRLTATVSADARLSVQGLTLFVDGQECGELTGIVNLRPVGPVDITLDVRNPWTHPFADEPFQPASVQLNVYPSGSGGELVFLGSRRAEFVDFTPGAAGFGSVRLQERRDFTSRLYAVFVAQEAGDPEGVQDLTFRLGGGGDQFVGGGSWGADVTVDGGPGNDEIQGGTGDEQLLGGPGRDAIRGGSGNDSIVGGPGPDRVFGEAGRDRFSMRDGARDVVDGGPGRDRCIECDGRDVLRAM